MVDMNITDKFFRKACCYKGQYYYAYDKVQKIDHSIFYSMDKTFSSLKLKER